MDLCHLENSELDEKVPQILKERSAPRWRFEGRLWFLCCIYGAGFVCIMSDGMKSSDVLARLAGCAGQASGAVICLLPSQDGGRSIMAENSQV